MLLFSPITIMDRSMKQDMNLEHFHSQAGWLWNYSILPVRKLRETDLTKYLSSMAMEAIQILSGISYRYSWKEKRIMLCIFLILALILPILPNLQKCISRIWQQM